MAMDKGTLVRNTQVFTYFLEKAIDQMSTNKGIESPKSVHPTGQNWPLYGRYKNSNSNYVLECSRKRENGRGMNRPHN